MAVLWSSFFPYIQPYLPSCPEVVITEHLREAAAEFCARSRIWRFDIERDSTVATLADYTIDVPDRTVLEDVLVLYLNDTPLTKVTDRGFFLRPNTENGCPTHFSIYQDTQVRFYPTPDDSYPFQGAGVLKPSLTATGVEDFIYETYGRCITYGAIGRIASVPNKEWSDPVMGASYMTRFYIDADKAMGRDTRRAANRRVVLRPFA